MYYYRAYGLHIASQLELPSLPVALSGSAPDALVRVAIVDSLALTHPSVDLGPWRAIDRNYARVEIPDVCVIEIADGRTISVSLLRGADVDIVASLIVGGILGGTLFQRGRLVLHASAVQIGEIVVAMTGASGAGKSTLAAALVASGHSLVSDDVLSVVVGDNGCAVEPAYPGLKLSASVLSALGHVEAGGHAVPGGLRQRTWHRVERFSTGRLRLGALIQLSATDRSDPFAALSPMSSREVFRLLLAQTLPTRTGRGGDEMHLTQTVRVAKAIPGFHLERPLGLDRLKDSVKVIERSMSVLSASC